MGCSISFGSFGRLGEASSGLSELALPSVSSPRWPASEVDWTTLRITGAWTVAAAPFARGVTSDLYELQLGTQAEKCVLKVVRDDGLSRAEVAALREVIQTELNALRSLEAANCAAAPRLRGTVAPTAAPVSTFPKIVMTFVEGLTLDRFLYETARGRRWQRTKREQQVWKTVFYAVRQPALSALRSVHEAGWVHGDLHARNIIIQASPEQVLSAAESSETSGDDSDLVEVVFVDWGSSKPKDEGSCGADTMALNDTIFHTWRSVMQLEDDYM